MIIFFQNFPFEDKESLDFVSKVQQSIEKSPTLFNLSTDHHLSTWFKGKFPNQLPVVYHNGKLAAIDQ